eukprot:scaffold21261_cov57-Cyclotella_meneghiniana.AAC.3
MKVYSNCLIVWSNCLFACTQSSALGGRWMKGYVGISRGRQQWSREKRAARQSTVVSAASAQFSHDQ